MKLSTLKYYFGHSFLALCRNGWMTVATIATLAITLFILGIFSLLVANTDRLATMLESELEIAAFLKTNLPQKNVEQIGKAISGLPGVAQVELISKEEGLASLSEQFGQDHDLLAALGGTNPLPDYYKIKVSRPEDVAPVAEMVKEIQDVDDVNYGKSVVDKLLQATAWVRWIGYGFMILLGLATVFLVAITIRLTVFARKKEIAIMKYVGATDWFIRWPFFLEGMFLGLVGGLVAAVILFFAYGAIVGRMQSSLTFIPLIADLSYVGRITLSLILIGACIGAAGSIVSVRKFLRV